jgi:hypothetical protein
MHLPCGCIVQRWSWLVERHSQRHIVASRTAHAEPFSQHKRYGGISIVAHLWPAWQPPYRLMTGAFGACPVEQQANVSRATRGHPKRAIDIATLSLRLFLYYFSNIGHAGLLQRTGCGESVDQRRMRGSARLLDSSSHDTDAGRLPSTCRNASSSSIHTHLHIRTCCFKDAAASAASFASLSANEPSTQLVAGTGSAGPNVVDAAFIRLRPAPQTRIPGQVRGLCSLAQQSSGGYKASDDGR